MTELNMAAVDEDGGDEPLGGVESGSKLPHSKVARGAVAG